MTTQNETKKNINWKTLYNADFSFNSSFKLNLADGQQLHANDIIRIIPKKRMVVFGVWLDRPVVAKLFFHPTNVQNHMSKDLTGIEKLRERKIPTPALFYQGYSEDKRIGVLIFERILLAKNLEEFLKEENDLDIKIQLLRAIVLELATQHVLGVVQQDLHLKNFLITERCIYTLDGAQIECNPFLLPKKTSMQNLALLLSQLTMLDEKQLEDLFRFYAKSRGWLLKNEDLLEMNLLIKKINQQRWKDYAKKIFRLSSEMTVSKTFRKNIVYRRKYASTEFLEFLKNPEAVFHHPSAHILKAGGSSTVVKVTLDGRDLVIKRYNMKNLWHRIRRTLRMTRARLSFRLANKLLLFGISTPIPIAFIENCFLCFRGVSYFVSEYVDGQHAGIYFKNCKDDIAITSMVKSISDLLKKLSKIEMTHGDLKITNILIDVNFKPYLIDFDGAKEHASLSSLRTGWRREIKRFLENFKLENRIQEKFVAEFD